MPSPESRSGSKKRSSKRIQEEMEVEESSENVSSQHEVSSHESNAVPMEEGNNENTQDEEEGIRIDDIYIPPPPPPACSFDTSGPRLVITHIENYFFKSYAGKQVLGPFHKNFTSIVGPNGSGKSNVIDSMLFVFGYRAQKIRSKKINVLIHNSNKYPNVESCSVHVHFQEIIDKPDDAFEVVPNSKFVVGRTAHKDNSSSYTINGKKVPFKEVGKLLRLHGVDLDHNRFLILQGEVEQIAMMKPKAQTEHDTGMLEFLEDIIGCSRFKEPIAILSKRVEELNENRTEKLNRVNVVEKEKDELEGAKNEAMESLKLQNEIFLKDNILHQYQKFQAEEDKKGAEGKKELLVQETKEFLDKLEALKTLRESHKSKYNEKKEITNKCLKVEDEKKADYSALERRDLQCRESLKHAKTKKKKLSTSLETEKQKLKDLKDQPEKNERMIEDVEKKKLSLEKKLEDEQANLEKVMSSMKKETEGLQAEKDNFEAQLLQLQKAVNDSKSKLNIQQSELELYLSTEKNEKQKLEDLEKNVNITKENLSDKNKLLLDLQKKIPDAEQQYRDIETKLPQLAEKESTLSNNFRVKRFRLEETRSTMQASKSRNHVLRALLEQKESGRIPGILGRLGDLGGIDEKYDIAISTACGPLDNIVTDTMDTAQTCVQFLKDHNVGVATFIALDKMTKWIPYTKNRIQTPENVPRLFDLLHVRDERVLPAFYFALRDTLVADNLDQATRIGLQGRTRHRVVTLKGELIDISGTMSGGGGRVSQGRMGKAVVQNTGSVQELEVMNAEIEQLSHQLDEIRQQKNVLEDRQAELQRELRGMTDTQKKCSSEVRLLSEQESALRQQIRDQKERVSSVHIDKNKVKQMQTTIAEAQKDFDKASGKAGKVEAEVQRLHNNIMKITGGKMEAAQKVVDKLNHQIDELTACATKCDVTAKTARRNMKKSAEKITSLEKEIEGNAAEMEKTKEELTALEDQARAVMKDLAKAKQEKEEVEKEMEQIFKDMDKVDKEDQELQSKNIKLKNEVKDCDECIGKLDKIIKDKLYRLSKIKLHPIDDQSSPELPQLTSEELESIDIQAAGAERQALNEKFSNMKPNMAAIEEFKRKESQYLQRVAELEAVTEQRDTQRGHYDNLRKQRLTDFMEGFTIITTKIKEVYQMLTLGGDAELELVDSLDPFSEGIIFSVRPPKKSWKNISNLSGGEKTLSSLALVFALHFYRPTSLYVMDEIDAALDFRNVSIVGHYIKQRTKNAQFIVISLRNDMFELADRLVGIFKTYDCTKSVTINPKLIGQTEDKIEEKENKAP